MSRIPTESGIPFRREQPQTQVVDTFVGLRAPGPQLQQPAELPRWQSELFDVAQALGGLSGSLNQLSQTWGKIGVEGEERVGEAAVLSMSPEQQREAAAMDWAELEKKNPELKGASPFRRLAVRQAAGKATVEQQLGKVMRENAERLSDPASDEDPRAFASQQLQQIVQGMDSFYGRDAGLRFGADMVEKFSGMVEESKRKRTVFVNDRNFQTEVKDALSERLSAEGDLSVEGMFETIKSIQDKYHTITGESGNLAVFESVQSLADTLISSGRYDDARELVRGMGSYSHNGQVTFGKMYAEQFSAIIDKADSREETDSRAFRQDVGYRLGQAASNAVFNIDASKLESMTEGDMKALAQDAVKTAGFGPEYFGEMYDSLLQIRDGQLQRLQRGKEADKEDLRLMMSIKRESMQNGADLPALEEKVHSAYAAGELKKDTAMLLLGQLENAKNHYGDNASPLVKEQRDRLGAWINPNTVPSSAYPEFAQIVSDLRAEFDDQVIAARDEVIADLNAKGVQVNPDSVNHHLGKKSKEIADQMMKTSETRFEAFRQKYEPRTMMREYQTASPMLNNAMTAIGQALQDQASAMDKLDPSLSAAMMGDRFKVQVAIRNLAQSKLTEFAAKGLEGQELYDAVDAAVFDQVRVYDSFIKQLGTEGQSFTGPSSARPDWPLWESTRAKNKSYAESQRLPAVTEETAGFTAAGRFGNKFRSWYEELNTEDPAAIVEAQANLRGEADKFVKEVASPAKAGITLSGAKILRDGKEDPEATATYWNAKVMWSGLSLAEIKGQRTDEGLQIPTQYLLSPMTRIKGLDSDQALREALVKFEADGTGPLADYRSYLPSEYNARDIVDFLRNNLKNTGIIEP
jgi:hypothetical protein